MFDYDMEERESIKLKKSKHSSKHSRSNKHRKQIKGLKKYYLFIVFLMLILIIILIFKLIYLIRNKPENDINNISILAKNNITNETNITDIINVTNTTTNESIIQNIINETNMTYTDKTNNMNVVNGNESLESGIEYISQCNIGHLLKNITNINISEPKISVIIPLYNCHKTIKSTIRSIQNQDMIDFEIILVNNDPTNGNTKIIIEELQKEDPRIKIINNNQNMGTLYARSIGALAAKGKYIISLDSDDMIFNKDVFEATYKEAEDLNFDIIAFIVLDGRGCNKNNIKINYSSNNKNNLTIYQPELGIYPITKNNTLYPNDIYIWGKLINTKIYKVAVNLLGKERYSNYINWVEDTIIFYLICNVAESFKFIGKYGLFHYIGSTTSIKQSKDNKNFCEIFLLDIIFDFSKIEYKKYAAYKLIEMKKYPFFSLSDERNKSFLETIIKKIMNCEYIEDKLKEQIKKLYNETYSI